jgi:hypothetical protein
MAFLRLVQGPLCKFAWSLCNFPISLGLLVMSSDVYECSFSGACTRPCSKKKCSETLPESPRRNSARRVFLWPGAMSLGRSETGGQKMHHEHQPRLPLTPRLLLFVGAHPASTSDISPGCP